MVLLIWLVFFITAYLAAFITVPVKEWRRLWPAGIITVVLLYMIDSTFIKLGAFSYTTVFSFPPGIPVLYLASSFGGGIILSYLNPGKKRWILPYIILAAAVFVFFELIMSWLGSFHYKQWSPLNSLFLDIVGFSAVLWLSQCFGAIGKR